MAAINETVRSAKQWLEEEKDGKEMFEKCKPRGLQNDRNIMSKVIATFLDWPQHRVQDALADLSAIKSGDLDREAIESLPGQTVET